MGSMRTINDSLGPASLPQETVIVTGGNSGLGYGCAAALLSASPRRHVILACRDIGRAQEAVETLRESASPGAQIETMVLDLASLASVQSFASKLEERLKAAEIPPLHGLVCNAAVQGARTFTADGFESTFGVSHLGHYLLVNLLVPLMEKPARIAVVASGVHDPAELAKVPASMAVPVPAWNTPMALAKGDLGPAAANDDAAADRGRRYSTTKLANVYFTYGLAQRLPQGITVNAFDPGLMPGTGLAREYPAAVRFAWHNILPKLIPLLRLVLLKNIHTTEESGAALARLIVDPALRSTNGKYFEGLREIPSSVESYDKDRAEELWRDSATLTGIEPLPYARPTKLYPGFK
ncbi:SDR family NAD(P)-dependent oxidoreductase [Granulicella sibirica]|uniref:Oxidoreductase, short-chain dehydrogenase/reductase family n=1 Tax=Granulicella sibirica TaxID=2479048 RepID=A0A4Q0SY87_9BACT|nr:SDR family NAD(P)-dependent oxidoreductase [Granulicella sibirica]RXH56183.1 oxidoreductase, short-chain dehydrogenase/reductase family [Granulicella sibirica]